MFDFYLLLPPQPPLLHRGFRFIPEFEALFRFAPCRGDAYCLPVICKYGSTEDFPPFSSRTNCLELISLRTHVELSSITHSTTHSISCTPFGACIFICVIVFCVEINSALHHQIYLSKCQTLSFRWQAFVNYSSAGCVYCVHSTNKSMLYRNVVNRYIVRVPCTILESSSRCADGKTRALQIEPATDKFLAGYENQVNGKP